ncbi:TetR/AcrR family transcriptional regulator [Mangrovibacillus cuniculi]|uniref:TetR/AcrR family transcriptional regulator n=1 Tax=Mangrovibacillus cuniculi TaxID=2593652 RepID=A0A7S8CE13_9BACI|nr:TetR/AcrR family transcriptional regulator [Mangrovibacillus cuniculi]QPC48088.1 TetR/AcrR family transcriptional regulator [Mangrovibacillus cuniculi]
MDRKQLIMEKALELFAKQGIESTSVQQITEYCGISKGAFYLTFKSKSELIEGIIDYFMTDIIFEVDRVVKHTSSNEDLLYLYYHTVFQTFQKHSDFAKLLVKEQAHPPNEEQLLKLAAYDEELGRLLETIVDKLYGGRIEHTKYDLIFSMKGFIKSYLELFIFFNAPINLDKLAKSLVEKTNILAENITIPFISSELKLLPPTDADPDKLVQMVQSKAASLDESLEKESLEILTEQLVNKTHPLAIIKGLITNISHHPDCKGVAFLLDKHFFK